MHDILKERIWRRLQALPQEQVYQALDYIEFLEAKYAREQARQPDAIQKFAERLEDGMRFRSVAPKVISGTVGLLGTARRVLRTVSDAGRDILDAAATPAGANTAPAGPTNTAAPNGRAIDTPPRQVRPRPAQGMTELPPPRQRESQDGS
jgi:hypothetical protein